MRVACPECTAEYDLPDALAARLGEGRTVRCARCGTTWAPAAPQPAEPPAAPAAQPETVSAMASAEPMPPTAPMEPTAPATPAISSAPAVPVAPAMPIREPALPATAGPDAQDALADLFTAEEPTPRHAPSPATRREAHSASPSTPPIATALAWTASVVALLGLAVAIWHWRFDIVEAWPPAVRAFMALGLG